jgi:CBS domain-containing protein
VIEEREMLTGRPSEPCVENLMTRTPIVVTEDDAIAGVAELLAGHEITGLPVVDAAGRLVGVISQTDLVRMRGSKLPWTGWHGILVRDLMTRPAKTIPGSAPVDEAARQMTIGHVHRLIVVDGRQTPIGVISESDIVREIADCCDDG